MLSTCMIVYRLLTYHTEKLHCKGMQQCTTSYEVSNPSTYPGHAQTKPVQNCAFLFHAIMQKYRSVSDLHWDILL